MKGQLKLEGKTIYLQGSVTLNTVMRLWKLSFPHLQQRQVNTIDFSQVERTDSAGLALMCEWLRYAKRNQFELSFAALPEQLLNMAQLTSTAALFQLNHQSATD